MPGQPWQGCTTGNPSERAAFWSARRPLSLACKDAIAWTTTPRSRFGRWSATWVTGVRSSLAMLRGR